MADQAVRRPRLSADERRAAIVSAAVRLFAEKGFRGATTRELAASVGVTEPVLYQHFATKGELYTAILESISTISRQCPDEGLARAIESGDDRAFFTQLANRLLGWYEDSPEVIRLLLFSALEGHELSDIFFERQIVVYYEMLTDYIRKRMDDGVFRPMDAYLAARAFTGMISHQGLSLAVFGCREISEKRWQVVELTVDVFLRGMTVSRSEPV